MTEDRLETLQRTGRARGARPANRPADGSTPPWVASALGGGIAEAARLAWGFTNESWVATVRDGRRLVATRLADATVAEPLRRRMALIGPRLGTVGLQVPVLVEAPGGVPVHDRVPSRIVLSEYVEGRPGADVLGEVGGPALVGRLMGEAWRRMAGVDPSGAGLPDRWAHPGELLLAARTWAAGIAARLPRRATARLDGRLADLPALLAGRPTGFVHGDLVPANVLIRGRSLAALLDLEAMRIADPLLDASWFDWIVWFHHPADEPAAREAFREAGGIGERDEPVTLLLSLLPAVRLLEILADPTLKAAARGRWLEQLVACLDRPAHGHLAGG